MEYGKTLLVLISISVTLAEPVCTKFAYEEQLLEKMVRVEFNVELMEKEIKNTNNIVQESLKLLQQNWEKLSKEFEEMKTETEVTMNHHDATLTREIEEMKTEIKETLNDYDAKMMKSEDAVSMPAIAFKARTPSAFDPGENQIVVFTKNVVNIGDAYNNNTGIFTAPIDGTYLFTSQVCLVNSKSITFGIYIENDLYTVGRFYDEKAYNCYNVETTAVMTAGENASVKSWSADAGVVLYEDENHRWNMFSGTLLHK